MILHVYLNHTHAQVSPQIFELIRATYEQH